MQARQPRACGLITSRLRADDVIYPHSAWGDRNPATLRLWGGSPAVPPGQAVPPSIYENIGRIRNSIVPLLRLYEQVDLREPLFLLRQRANATQVYLMLSATIGGMLCVLAARSCAPLLAHLTAAHGEDVSRAWRLPRPAPPPRPAACAPPPPRPLPLPLPWTLPLPPLPPPLAAATSSPASRRRRC